MWINIIQGIIGTLITKFIAWYTQKQLENAAHRAEELEKFIEKVRETKSEEEEYINTVEKIAKELREKELSYKEKLDKLNKK